MNSKPSQDEIQGALDTLERAGFSISDCRRLVEFNQSRKATYTTAINDAKDGDADAAMFLVKIFSGDLMRAAAPWQSDILFQYFRDVMGAIARGEDPLKALHFKFDHRPKSPAVKARRGQALAHFNELHKNESYDDAIAKVGELLSIENPKRDIAAAKKEQAEFAQLQAEFAATVNGDRNPGGVIVLT